MPEDGAPALGAAPAAIERLERYDWPGNIRELRKAMDRATALCGEGDTIDVAQLPAECAPPPGPADESSAPSAPPPSAPRSRR